MVAWFTQTCYACITSFKYVLMVYYIMRLVYEFKPLSNNKEHHVMFQLFQMDVSPVWQASTSYKIYYIILWCYTLSQLNTKPFQLTFSILMTA